MGLYRLQVSQHQLQKDVTHQLSRFLVNRRDDEADLSDMAKQEGVTEVLKAADQMEWVRRMNNIRSRAEEIVLIELVYE